MITIAILKAAGLSPDQIVRILELEQQADRASALETVLSRRERDRIRKKNQRQRPRNPSGQDGEDGTPRTERDTADPPPLKKKVSDFQEKTTPPPDPSGLRPSAPAAPTRADLERDFYNRGKQVLGKNAGGLLTSLLKAKQQDIALARSTLELAATKADPRDFVAAACKTGPPRNGHPRPTGGGFAAVLDKLTGGADGTGNHDEIDRDDPRTIDHDPGLFG